MKIFLFSFMICCLHTQAQFDQPFLVVNNTVKSFNTTETASVAPIFGKTLYQRNSGVILGLQRGNFTNIEMGAEAHWRKISLLKPSIIGATTNLEYNFKDNVIGYKAGIWMKKGIINLTYGANISYHTNFSNGNRFGFGPSVGFRLLGFHLVNGFTFLTKDKTIEGEKPVNINSLYMSLRYYFPVENKFTWDRNTMKKKKANKKAKAQKQKERERQKANGEKKSILDIFKKSDKAL